MKNVRFVMSAAAVCVMALGAYGCSSDDDVSGDDDEGASSSSGKSSSGNKGSSSGKSSSSSGGKSSSGTQPGTSSGEEVSSSSSGSSSGEASSSGDPTEALGDAGITADASVLLDASAGDGGVSDAGVALTCPGNLGPIGYNLGPSQGNGDCTPAQVTAFRFACLDDSSTQAGCSAYLAAPNTTACGDCLAGNATDFGAFISFTKLGVEYITPNRNGCFAKLSSDDPTCFQASSNLSVCQYANCESCANDAVFDTCYTSMGDDSVNGCGVLSDYAEECLSVSDEVLDACTGVDFADAFDKVGTVLCGPPN